MQSQFIIEFSGHLDPVLQQAHFEFEQCRVRADTLVASKEEIVAGYDPAGMLRAATICHWGRSGSVLLASYLDDHPDIITLPNQTSEHFYHFYADYADLPVWQKLIAYPFYSASKRGGAGDYFLNPNPDGDYAIERDDYFSSVIALARLYGRLPHETINSRQWFVRLAHIAYAAALGRKAANPRPLMITAQHWFHERYAALLNEDFPGAQFIHSIRDPISGFDSWLERHFTWQFRDSPVQFEKYCSPALDAYINLLSWDAAHRGAELRTRAVRFEDLHLRPEETMRKLAVWLGVRFGASMTQSTLNGRPYVFTAGGVSWVGANPKNVHRRSSNLSRFDQSLLFALLHGNFKAWSYPEPMPFSWRLIRWGVIIAGVIVPTRMEIANARLNVAIQAAPASRAGRARFACLLPLILVKRRIRFSLLIVHQALLRSIGKRVPMTII